MQLELRMIYQKVLNPLRGSALAPRWGVPTIPLCIRHVELLHVPTTVCNLPHRLLVLSKDKVFTIVLGGDSVVLSVYRAKVYS